MKPCHEGSLSVRLVLNSHQYIAGEDGVWRSRVLRVAAPGLLALFCACGSTSPGGGPQAFALVSYDGRPLPVVLRVISSIPVNGGRGTNCDDDLTAVALNIDANGAVIRRETNILKCDDGRPDSTTTVSYTGQFLGASASPLIQFDKGAGGGPERYYGETSGSTLTIKRREVDYVAPLGGMTINVLQLGFARVP